MLCACRALRHREDPYKVHPVRNPRFASFRTQPLENLSAAVKLPIKTRFLGNPTLGTNRGSRILAMRTGCITFSDGSRYCSCCFCCRNSVTLEKTHLCEERRTFQECRRRILVSARIPGTSVKRARAVSPAGRSAQKRRRARTCWDSVLGFARRHAPYDFFVWQPLCLPALYGNPSA